MKEKILQLLKEKRLKLLMDCPNSKIYVYEGKFLVKKYKIKNPNLKKEFNNQKKAYEIFEEYNDNVFIPKPRFISLKNDVIIMDYIKSMTLTDYLKKNNLYFKGKKLKEIFYKIAKALNYFHKKANWKADESIEDKMHSTIQKIKLQPFYKKYLKLKLIMPKETKKQRIYGNFKAQNILISKSKIYFIDFAYDYKGSIYHDFAKLMESAFTAGFRNKYFPLYNFKRLKQLEKSFLNGYFRDIKIADKRLLNYYKAFLKIHDLNSCKSNKIPFKILKWIYYFRIKKLIRKLIEMRK